ncbi:SRSF protein kinase 2-like [Sinocyclocheilus rhinocerous]|uniref:SRSF protein kinase 2-like n=1 Tax=Sinocyclocheilus rhinocerous TaxID=307959 RepID=UPI0007BA1A18|nr:PREDICTED: SRSF protein kinase 2-like [Sinocyclocheilus rhinocerous]
MDDTTEMHSPDSGVDSPGFSDTATTELISHTDSEHTSSADEWVQQGPNLPPLFPPHPPPPPPLPILPPQEDPEDVMGVLDVAS